MYIIYYVYYISCILYIIYILYYVYYVLCIYIIYYVYIPGLEYPTLQASGAQGLEYFLEHCRPSAFKVL